MVRLGATSDSSPTKKNFPIAKFIQHEDYNRSTKQNDIALVQLSKKVDFNNPTAIRPACLWQTAKVSQPKVIATGFGLIQYAGVRSASLQKVKLDLLETDYCVDYWNEDDDIIINSNQICSGILSGGRDTCQGGERIFLIAWPLSNEVFQILEVPFKSLCLITSAFRILLELLHSVASAVAKDRLAFTPEFLPTSIGLRGKFGTEKCGLENIHY